MQPSEDLFRRESGRILTALTRIFGFDHILLAQDVVQDTFCRAVETWRLRGVPDNPSAWLMRTAKNRAIDLLRRERTARNQLPELARELGSEWTLVPTVDSYFNAEAIKDDQLRMIFSCCDPHLPEQVQVALTLNLVCGFTAGEIAAAFLSKRATIEKRIARGKQALARAKELFDLGDAELATRLSAVHRTVYLLFSEGYHGASPQAVVRAELCREAMRLASSLLENPLTATPVSHALCALIWLHAARLPARVDSAGELIAFFDQDRACWDRCMIAKGNEFLEQAATGSQMSAYHLEAAIASLHAGARRIEDTDWIKIVWLYDMLLKVHPSPVVALNRAVAIAQRDGPERGIEELNAIAESGRLEAYLFYPAALGELEFRSGHLERARRHFETALSLARNPMERRFLQSRLKAAT